MDWNDIPHDLCHLGVPSGASKVIFEPMVHLVQTVHLACTDTNIVLKRIENEIPLEPRHLGVPSGESKMISKPMVHSVQTVHLSCVRISNISKQTESSFYLSPITNEFHRVRPKRFVSLRYIRRKLSTYLASRLALSPNGSKRASTWALSPWSTIRSVQNDF
jgi:hypothetical protein